MTRRALLSLTLVLAAAAPTQARHHHRHKTEKPRQPLYSWERHKLDLTPVAVKPYSTPKPAAAAIAGTPKPAVTPFVRKMNLEDGVFVHGTQFITRPDIRSRDLFILHATQSLEGGFDTVNLYDKGIVSWGLMQWTARSGSLTECLKYIKRSLIASGDRKVWEKYFVSNGVDVTSDNLVFYGKPMLTPQDMRLAIRGTMKVGQGDPNLMNHWVTTFARAGRQGQIAGLEIAYASRVVDAMMNSRLDGVPYRVAGRNGVTPVDLSGDDPFAQALMFAIWTNNPRHARQYISDAAKAAREVSSSDDPSLWEPGSFSDALFRECSGSRFGNWSTRAAMIQERAATVRTASASELSPFEAKYQQVIAQRKQVIAERKQIIAQRKQVIAQREHERLVLVASRHSSRHKQQQIAALPKSKPLVAKPPVSRRPIEIAAKPVVVRIAGVTNALDTRAATDTVLRPTTKPMSFPQEVVNTYGRLHVIIPCEAIPADPASSPAGAPGALPDPSPARIDSPLAPEPSGSDMTLQDPLGQIAPKQPTAPK